MNGSVDDDRGGGRDAHGSLDVRELLEEASWPAETTTVLPHDAWLDGRRRRSRKRAGAGVVAGVSALAVAGLVWQTGVFGGTAGEREPHVATVPTGLTTFVLAAPGAPAIDVSAIDELSVPSAEDLEGTRWVLTDQVYGSGQAASQVVGSDAETIFSFSPESWGFVADGCGGAGDQGPVEVADDGSFTPPELGTDDQGCPEPAQRAEDFWMEALSEGGSLHLLGDGDWLLLSVDVPAGVAQAPTTVQETAEPDPSQEPAPARPTDPATGEEPTGEQPTGMEPTGAEPTGDRPSGEQPGVRPTGEEPSAEEPSAEEPSGEDPSPEPGEEPSVPAAPEPTPPPATGPSDPGTGAVLAGFTTADQVVTSAGWPDASGQLFAPTLRAGLNDGFDRVVVDLVGSGAPSWYGYYPEVALRDGSGLPVQIAGDSVLEVVIGGMAYPEPGDPVYDGGDAGLDLHRLDGLDEVIRTTPFEGQLQLFVGLQGEPRPYRVFLLQDPMRLVVDVQHAG